MRIQVHQRRGPVPDPIRIVEIPLEEATTTGIEGLLDLVFHYGQNDFQPVPDRASVSVGDVIELSSGDRYRVQPFGFERVES